MVGNGTVRFMGTLQVEYGMPNQGANGSTWMRLTLDASTCHLNLFTCGFYQNRAKPVSLCIMVFSGWKRFFSAS